MGMRQRMRMDTTGDEPGEMGDIGEQERAGDIGNLPEPFEIDGPGIGGTAANDQFRPVFPEAISSIPSFCRPVSPVTAAWTSGSISRSDPVK